MTVAEATAELAYGQDFRRPEHRRETFLRFYEFHLRYRTHPGCVYFLIPTLRRELEWSAEETVWFAAINAMTQHPVTSLLIHRAFPHPQFLDGIDAWVADNRRRLPVDTDRRHWRTSIAPALRAYAEQVPRSGGLYWSSRAAEGWPSIWKAATAIPTLGRLSAWSFIEYLRVAGVNIDADSLMLDDRDGSRSHRNGLAIVSGHDEWDWHDSNPAFDGCYTPDTLDFLAAEADDLLAEARRRSTGTLYTRDVTRLTLESALCTYKSWHRPNRRYPNVYADLLHDRIRGVERAWPDEDLEVFWRAREQALPKHLRLEDNSHDPGVSPIKQNWYLATGCPPMMSWDWPCFDNTLDELIRTERGPRYR